MHHWQGSAHRLRVVLKHLPRLLFGASLLHTLPLQMTLFGLLKQLVSSAVSAEKVVRLLRRQWHCKQAERGRETSSSCELLRARDTAVPPTWIGVVPWLCSALRGCLLAYLRCEEPQTSSRIQQQLRANSLMFNSASNPSFPARNLPHSKPNPNSVVSAAHSTFLSLARSLTQRERQMRRFHWRKVAARSRREVRVQIGLGFSLRYEFKPTALLRHTPLKSVWRNNPHDFFIFKYLLQ